MNFKTSSKNLKFNCKLTFLQEVPHRKDVRKPLKIMLNDMKIHVVHWKEFVINILFEDIDTDLKTINQLHSISVMNN